MKRIPSVAILLITLATLSVPSRVCAQQNVRYRLVDLGTFGGPNSSETLVSPYINNKGMVVGFADTSNADPFHPGAYIPRGFL